MKSQTCYKTLDKLHAKSSQDDRANRGVKPLGWLIVVSFSLLFWYTIYNLFIK